jgi:hypothetical protein
LNCSKAGHRCARRKEIVARFGEDIEGAELQLDDPG